ncbi:MAG: ATP-binding protein [Leptospiraceae bacterium]|nr:hypothetical protein [Leptospiraceae bacterium]MCK6381639.1 ATP-binding protein [Leptospiraceae bacterium]NUM41091.1 hypothetical protein [Leptospiraceae bacterium]
MKISDNSIFYLIVHPFRNWKNRQDVNFILAATNYKNWIVSEIFLIFMFAIISFLPKLNNAIGLTFWVAIFGTIPVFIGGILTSYLLKKQGRLSEVNFLLLTISNILLYGNIGVAMIASEKGTLLFGSLLLFVGVYHSYFHQVNIREPFLALGMLLVFCFCFYHIKNTEDRSILLVMCSITITAMLISGKTGKDHFDNIKKQNELRALMDAQIIESKTSELVKLSGAFIRILGNNHDAGNSISAMRFILDDLYHSMKKKKIQIQVIKKISTLQNCLKSIETTWEDIKNAGQKDIGKMEVIETDQVVKEIFRLMKLRFPNIKFILPTTQMPSVFVNGGNSNLYRIFENIVLNACQGDGKIKAKQIVLNYSVLEKNRIALILQDDGPGFQKEILASPLSELKSSKKDGSGLGLYTAYLLATASGGTIIRENNNTGAKVSLILNLATFL